MENAKPILLVEDDNVDAMTVKRAMRDLSVANSLIHLVNGEEALVYLSDGQKPKPFLILLDLNMPKMNGIEFLRRIKADEDFRKIPVIVLTTSKEKSDVIESFGLGAAGYMVKPVDYARFVEIIGTIMLYWRSNELPKQLLQTTEEQLQTNTVR